MTALIGRRGDHEPTTCLVCGRLAWGIGVAPSEKKPIGWLCKSPECVELGHRIYVMHAKELSRIEAKAIETAGERVFSEIVETIFGAMWDANVKSLEAVTPEIFASLSKSVCAKPEYRRAMGNLLTSYGDQVKALVDAGEPPF